MPGYFFDRDDFLLDTLAAVRYFFHNNDNRLPVHRRNAVPSVVAALINISDCLMEELSHVSFRMSLSLSCCAAVLPNSRAFAFDSLTATASFYDGVNLTTGMTEVDPTVLTLIIGSAQEIERIAAPEIDPLFHFSASVNLSFGFTTDPAQPILLQPQAGVVFAVVEQTDPASLTETQLAALNYAAQPVAVAPHQLIVAKLDDGAYRIVGQVASNPDATVQFTVWTPESGSVPTGTPTPPVSVPDPGTFALLAVGLLGVWRIFTRITQHHKGGNQMNGRNLCLGIFAYLLLSANFVAAAKVTVVRIGTGNGEVEGEGFHCGSTCQKEYPENTVLRLKAIPEEGSRFIEWLVNGVKHEGTLRVNNEEMIVSARFEKLEWVLPEFAVWWYEGNEVFVELMALDEIVVHFDEQQLQEEEQLQRAIEMVKQQFTAPVEIRDVEDFEDFWVWFQIPAIRSFEEFKAISQRLKQLPLVKQVSPVLYNDLDDREDWMIPTGKIYIQYPESFTETHIAFFEAKHHLVRVVEQFSETFIY